MNVTEFEIKAVMSIGIAIVIAAIICIAGIAPEIRDEAPNIPPEDSETLD